MNIKPKYQIGDIVTSFYNQDTKIIITDITKEKLNGKLFHYYSFHHIGSFFGSYYTIEKTITIESDDFLILVTDIFREI